MKRKPKKTFEETKKIIKNKDGVLLKKELKNKNTVLTIKCNKDGNIWEAKIGSINRGQWCRECYRRSKVKKIDKQKVLNLLADSGFELVTTGEINFWTKIKIRCPKHEHEWETTYGTLVRGNSNCKYCGSGTIDLKTIKDQLQKYDCEFIKRTHGKCPVRNMVVRCRKHNHTWKTNCVDIMKHDRWCIHCAWEARKTPYEKIKNIVESNDATLLTENCSGSLTKIMVRCKNDHEFETYYDNINQGYWCPLCADKEGHQYRLYEVLKKLYPDEIFHYNYKGFDWLKMNKKKRHKMEIDIFLENMRLAVEYDGQQHFIPTKFSYDTTDEQALKNLRESQRRDRKKNKLIAAHQDEVKYFIRFSYKDSVEMQHVIRKLQENNIPIPDLNPGE
jgi:hypothetical protein